MKRTVIILLVYMLPGTGFYCRGQSGYPQVFVGSTPCSEGTRPVPGMDMRYTSECIQWKLVLRAHDFLLHCIYGVQQQGSTNFKGGGKTIDLGGSWQVSKQVGDMPGIIYRLTDNKTNKSFSFLRLSDQVLHLLDNADHLMIGTAAWSYTLSRAGTQ